MTSDWQMALIGAGSAIAGGLLTGFYKHALDFYRRPILNVDYEGGEANRVEIEYEREGKNIAEVYIRARVRNLGRSVAKGCRVFLVGLNEVHPSNKTTITTFRDSMMVPWAYQDFSSRDIPKGTEFYVDVVKVSKHNPDWVFTVKQLFTNQKELPKYRGTYRFHLLVTADNAKPAMCKIDATYNGDWHNLRAVSTGVAN